MITYKLGQKWFQETMLATFFRELAQCQFKRKRSLSLRLERRNTVSVTTLGKTLTLIWVGFLGVRFEVGRG